jgi:hypothetical protein
LDEEESDPLEAEEGLSEGFFVEEVFEPSPEAPELVALSLGFGDLES